MRVDLPHPLAGIVPQVGAPLRFSATPLAYDAAAAAARRAHGDVLRERLGYRRRAIDELAARGVIATARP